MLLCGCSALALSFAPVRAQSSPPDGPAQNGELPLPAEAPLAPPPDASLPPVEPVFTEEEYREGLPPLPEDDGELAAPLESIEAFETRTAAERRRDDAQDASDASAPAPVQSALSDGDPNEPLADAAVTDPALAQPLPAISAFDVEPVEIGEVDDGAETEVRYTLVIDGLDAADAAAEDSDMAGLFRGLSALEDADGKAANVAMLDARAEEDAALLKTILDSEGWYDARVDHVIEQPAAEGARLTARLRVTPGERYRFGSITVAAAPTTPPGLADAALALKVGEPIVANRVQGAEANVALRLPEQGYPFATVGQRDILLDGQTHAGDYTLPVEVGPLGRFGGFTTGGDLAFGAEHVETLARFERGELYDSRKIDDLRQALVATGLFATVAVEPKASGEATDAGDGSQYITIDVTQDAGPPRTIAGSAGYGTGQGFRLEGSWTHRNLFPPEGALIASGIAGTQEQALGVTFRRSNAGRRDRTVELTAAVNRGDFDAYEAFTGRLSGRISYDSTPIWQKRFTYSYGFELIGTNEDSYDFDLGERTRQTYGIVALPGQVGIDTSDDLLNPTKGFRVTARVSPEASVSDGVRPYGRVLLDGTGYYPIGDSFVLASRLRFGSIFGIERADLAPSRRYYAGGGGSVRGFGYQELGPKDPEDRPVGGRSLNEAAAEVRYRFGNFGVVGFVDAGQVYEGVTPQFSDIRFGAGIGGRFYTNFGPFRLDVATPIGRRDGESVVSVYVSIGQAF